MRLILFFSFLFFVNLADAQVKKILHQSFEIEESDQINLDLVGEYEIVAWAGNSVLIETNIELYSASRDIYNFFKEQGRYDVELDSTSSQTNLRSVDKERKPIKTRKGECFEIVRVRVLVPEDFNVIDQKTLVRSEPTIKDEEDQ